MPRRRRSTRASGARVLVDSGAWIALVRARDAHHEEADAMFRRALRERASLLTTSLVLAEVQRFILFHAGPKAAAHVLERIQASPLLSLEFPGAAEHARALAWLAKLDDQTITYTDAVSFAVMEGRRCGAVMSFDADFVTAGFALWGASK